MTVDFNLLIVTIFVTFYLAVFYAVFYFTEKAIRNREGDDNE